MYKCTNVQMYKASLATEDLVMFGFGKSKEREKIENDLKILLDAGVDVRIEGRGTFMISAKNLDKVPGFKDRADRVRSLVNKEKATTAA